MVGTNCEFCSLNTEDKIVPSGSIYADIMLIGEAPGAEETKRGEPFVGRSGKILRSILNYLDLDKERVYITNMVMCRPPENRNPSKEEIGLCSERLMSEIASVNPKVIVTLGKVAGETLLGGKLKTHRGRVTDYWNDMKGIMTYHPAATLYGKGDSLFPFILEDLNRAKQVADGKYSEYDTNTETKVFVVRDDEDMKSLLNRLDELGEGTFISFDWETTGLSPLWDTGFCLGLSFKTGTGVAIPMPMVRRWRKEIGEKLSEFPLVGYNALLFDSRWNEKYGLPSDVSFDPQLYHYLTDEIPQQRSLTNLSYKYLYAPDYEGEMLAKYDTEKENMIEEVPPDILYEYCAKDVDWALRLTEYFVANLDRELFDVYTNIIEPGTKAFTRVIDNGFWVDREHLDRMREELRDKLDRLEVKLGVESGNPEFNPRSPQQISRYLFDELKLKAPKLYGKDEGCVDKDVVAAMIEKYPDIEFLKTLYDYRENFTLYSRYVRDLPDFIQPDGRVRCSYHFDMTRTGRLSTSKPSIHQIPRESDIRGVFSVPPGQALIQADYSQVEVRMAAHIAKDEALIEALLDDKDFHSLMASHAYRVPYNEVTPDLRQAAKGVSFGMMYLMSDKGLIAQTGLPSDDAIEFVKYYKEITAGVQKWIAKIKAEVRDRQYVVSPFGRRRRFPLLTDSNIEAIYREAVNFPIQSGASDLTLLAIIEADKVFREHYPEAKIIAMVHDSILVELPEPIAQEVADVLQKIMEDVPFEAEVPFPAEVKIGRRWGG